MAKRLSNEEKLELMLGYESTTGEKIKANTEYKGYQIGHIRNNLRQAYFNGTLKMEEDLLKKFIQSGFIKEDKERKKKTSTQEKYDFLIKMVGKTESELECAKMENGASFTAVRNSLQSSYNNGKLDLKPEQIESLIKAGFLNYSKAEQEEAIKKYGIPARYVQDITRRYGSYENFLEKYKKKEVDYDFGDDVFCGARCVTLSGEELTAVQKLAYYNLVRTIRGNTPGEPLAYIDIDEIERILSEKLSEIEIQTIKLRFGFDGKKHSLEECARIIGITLQRVRLIEQKALRKLFPPNITRMFFGIGKRDEESLAKYRAEYDGIEEYIKEFNIIRKFITGEEGKLRTDITDIILSRIGVSGKIFLDGIIENRTMKDLIESAKPEKREVSEEVLQIPIESLELSSRSINGLKRNKINTISDLLKYSERELLSKRYLGAKSVREILGLLINMGLTCRTDDMRNRGRLGN